MLTKTFGSAVQGVNAYTITIEVVVSQGTGFFVVGLPDNAIKESQQRVEAALKFRGYRMPRTKVVVNMAPADIRKEGSAYDLPIGLGILHASQQLDTDRLADYVIMGELALDGELRPIKGGTANCYSGPQRRLQRADSAPRECPGGRHRQQPRRDSGRHHAGGRGLSGRPAGNCAGGDGYP